MNTDKGNNKVLVTSASSFSGPLPPPADLAKYNEAVPDAAERIIKMAEKEQDNRHKLQEKELRDKGKLESRGQCLGFILAVLFAGISVFLAYLGHVKLAFGFSAPLILGVCAIFVLRIFPYRKE